MSLISVIVPVYNIDEIYLNRCIDSILKQSFFDFELILVDDGSTEKSEIICDYYATLDYRIMVLHKHNGGVSLARNLGLDFACGKYICFIDSDDYILPDYLAVLFSTIEKTNADYVSQNLCFVKADTEAVFSHDTYEIVFRNEKERYDFLIHKVLQGKTGWEMCARIFRHKIIRDYNIRACETCENYAEDLSFFIIFLLHCEKCCHINYAGYCYFQRSNSMMHKSREKIKLNSINEVSHYIFCYLEDNGFSDYLSQYPLLHFWIMKTEFIKFFEGKKELVPIEAKKIVNWSWYKRQTKKCIYFFSCISHICGTNAAFDYCNLFYFTLHRNYKVYFFIDVFYYKYWTRLKNVKY